MSRFGAIISILLVTSLLASCGGGDKTFMLYLTLDEPYVETTEDGSCHGASPLDFVETGTQVHLRSQDSDFAVSTNLGEPTVLGDGACQFVTELVAPQTRSPYILYVGDEAPLNSPNSPPHPIDLSETDSLTVHTFDGQQLLIAGDF